MVTKTRKTNRKEELRDLILDAALKVFVEEGLEHLSIRRIAEIIGYSPTTIYLYFNDKNHLLFELCELGFLRMAEMNNNLSAIQNPLERLHRMGENYIKFGLEHPAYYDLMFNQEGPMERLAIMDNAEWNSGDRAFAELKEIISDCIEQGMIRKGDTNTIAMAVWGMVHGLVSLRVCKRFDKLIDAENVVQTLHSSLEWLIQSIYISEKRKKQS
jgi:AcrR family transcriptional regulator